MQLVVISGRSGSGKSTALHQLEDLGYYCVDNLPASLLTSLAHALLSEDYATFNGIAVCIDARNPNQDLRKINAALAELPDTVKLKILFLDAAESSLIKRFSETRRKHPLSSSERSLAESIAYERQLLEPMAALADLTIDTTDLNLYDLRSMITERLSESEHPGLSILIQSFGFKRGLPRDADLVFDARLLPNPHWVAGLRALTGRDQEVANFLASHEETEQFLGYIKDFLLKWLPQYQSSQRTYMTVAIGCTGGQHRSVYIAERLNQALSPTFPKMQLRHRELSESKSP